MGNSGDRSRARGVVPAIAGVFLMIGAWLCAPDRASTIPVQLALWTLTLSLAAGGIALVVRRRIIPAANVSLSAGAAVASLLFLEAALAVAGVQPLKRIVWRVPYLAAWWSLDPDRGGRIDGTKYQGPWEINAAGFPDRDEFNAETAARVPRRVLLLGDSFAFGAGASTPEKTFPELLDRALDETAQTLVWNASIPGTGQSSQYQLLREYLPILKPQVVVATLYRNDFDDNLRPLDRFFVFNDGAWVDRYEGSPLGRLRALSPEQAYRRAFAPQSAHEVLKTLRSASAIAALLRRMFPEPLPGAGSTPGYAAAGRWLNSMQAACEAAGARFVVLHIPDRDDLNSSTAPYFDAVGLVSDVHLEAVQVRDGLKAEDYAPLPDTHWNDRGHAVVAETLRHFLESTWDPAPSMDSTR